MPQQASYGSDADDEENRADRKQETEKAQKQFHRGTNVIAVNSVEPNSSSAPRDHPAVTRTTKAHWRCDHGEV
jgi:hypothetical protein